MKNWNSLKIVFQYIIHRNFTFIEYFHQRFYHVLNDIRIRSCRNHCVIIIRDFQWTINTINANILFLSFIYHYSLLKWTFQYITTSNLFIPNTQDATVNDTSKVLMSYSNPTISKSPVKHSRGTSNVIVCTVTESLSSRIDFPCEWIARPVACNLQLK